MVTLTVSFWRTRASLKAEVAQLKEFSSASESETFQRIATMNDNIVAKNREIAELGKSQRSLQKSVKRCEDEKNSVSSERDSLSLKIEECTTRLKNSRDETEKLRQECNEKVRSHDTVHVEKDTRIQQLQDEINRISEQLKQAQAKDPPSAIHVEENENPGEKQKVDNRAQQQQQNDNQEKSSDSNKQENIRITEDVDHSDDMKTDQASGKQNKKPRKKRLSMLKEHMGIGTEEEY